MDISVYINGASWHLEQAEKKLADGLYSFAQDHIKEANRLLGEAKKVLRQ